MACSSPIVVRNPTKDYVSGAHKVHLTVPCGKCFHCVSSLQKQWAVRTYFELQGTKNTHNHLFLTLTYDPLNIPSFTDELNSVKYNFTVFNHGHIKTLLNSLRKRMARSGCEKGLRYLVASEFGSHNTCAPHYHTLFFVPKEYDPRRFFQDVKDLWFTADSNYRCKYRYTSEHLVHSIEFDENYFYKSNYGFVFPEDYDGLILHSKSPALVDPDDPKCARYVAKYCCKDMFFYSIDRNDGFMEYFTELCNHPVTNEEKIKELKQTFPRHFQSKGFGKYMCDYILEQPDSYQAILDGFRFLDTPQYLYPIPRYVEDKLSFNLYYVERDGKKLVRRTLTDFGVNLKSIKFDEDVKRSSHDLEFNCSFLYLNSVLTSQEIITLTDGDCRNSFQLFDKFAKLRNGASYTDLSLYKHAYENKIIPKEMENIKFLSGDQQRVALNFDAKTYFMQSLMDIYVPADMLSKQPLPNLPRDSMYPDYFNSLECFKGFSEFFHLYGKVQTFLSSLKNYNKAKINDIVQRITKDRLEPCLTY